MVKIFIDTKLAAVLRSESAITFEKDGQDRTARRVQLNLKISAMAFNI